MQLFPLGHAVLQLPQCAGFELRSTHAPAHNVVPPRQGWLQVPLLQS